MIQHRALPSGDPRGGAMIRLSDDEAWAVLADSHTGILTTLRRDGMPVSLPVWFVVDARTIVIRTPPVTKKVKRIRRDPRAAFLVESGERWIDLRGIHLSGTVELVEAPASTAQFDAALDAKYAAFRPDDVALPAATQARYAQAAFMRFTPEGRILTWDNSRLLGRSTQS